MAVFYQHQDFCSAFLWQSLIANVLEICDPAKLQRNRCNTHLYVRLLVAFLVTKAREKTSISIILFLCPTTEPPCVGRLTGMHRNVKFHQIPSNSPKTLVTSTSFHPTAHRHKNRSNRKGDRKWWLQKLILQTLAGSNECGQRQTEQDPSKHSITAKRLRWEVCLPEKTRVSH